MDDVTNRYLSCRAVPVSSGLVLVGESIHGEEEMLIRDRRRSVCLVAVAILLIFPGCNEDETTCPPCGSGEIFGEITTAGEPVDAHLTAINRTDSGSPRILFDADTDSAGQYSFQLPAGRYTIQTSIRQGTSGNLWNGTLSRDQADTFNVVEGMTSRRVDLHLSTLQVEIQTPPSWDGRAISLEAVPAPGEGVNVYGYGVVADGQLIVPLLSVPHGTYRLRLGFIASTHKFWLPHTYQPDEADLVEVGVNELKTYQASIPSPAILTGAVDGSWIELQTGRPSLVLYTSDSIHVAAWGTDDQGTFTVEVYQEMRARLLIAIEGVLRWHGGDGFEEASELDLRLGQETGVEILESGIAGFLGADGQGVELYDEAGRRLGKSNLVGDDGLFRLPNLTPDRYYLRIDRGDHWIPHWFDGADEVESATPILIEEEGTVVWIEPVNLIEGGRISGQILDPNGEPILAGWVLVTGADPPQQDQHRHQVASEEGRYEIRHVEDGRFKVGAWTGTQNHTWYPGVADWDSAEVITIEGHEHLSGIDIQLRE
jgi:hypothetical protein